jgi:hypothetical protein
MIAFVNALLELDWWAQSSRGTNREAFTAKESPKRAIHGRRKAFDGWPL